MYGQGLKNQRGNSQRAFFKPPYSWCPPFWVDVVNSCWLASTHASLPGLPKFSNIHNFWSVLSKIMKFVFLQILFQGKCPQKVSKSLKIKWDQGMLPKSGLFLIGISNPLGVKSININNEWYILKKFEQIFIFYKLHYINSFS